MKVALVHDWLNTKFGGAENMLVKLADMYPDAPIYTLLYNPESVGDNLDPARIRPSMLQRAPRWLQARSRYLLPLVPAAVEQFDLSSYALVISSSSAWAKGVITRPETLHICYCHTPMRFVWDYWPRYVAEQHVDFITRQAIYAMTSRLRLWDYYSSARVDKWVANSETTAARIKKYYHQKPEAVIYPGADLSHFKPAADNKGEYYVTLSSLTPYKKIDMAITACNQLNLPLTVIGDGSDRARLERLAGPTITFAGRVGDEQKAALMTRAKALIFPNEEDFGIVPIEAMASGTPVIAYGRGGLTETVIAGKTGKFFLEPTVESLMAELKTFNSSDYKTEDLTQRAAQFGQDRFERRFHKFVEDSYANFTK